MKKAITIWAIEGGTTGDIPVLEAAQKVKDAGFDAIEASFGNKGELSFDSDYMKVKKLHNNLQKKELIISSLSTLLLNEVSLISEDIDERNNAFNICTRMIEIASELGIDTVSISPGRILKGKPYRDCYNRSLEQVEKLVEIAEKADITLCVENVWQGMLLSPMEFAAYCDGIDSPHLAACIDIGNSSISTYAQHWISELAQRVRKVHITDLRKRKNTIYEFVDPTKGDTDWIEVMGELHKTGYDGYLTIEAFHKSGLEDGMRLVELSKYLDQIMEMNCDV